MSALTPSNTNASRAQHFHLALLVLTLTVPLSAWAEGADDVQFRASLGTIHDSNLFRLPNGANAQASIGSSSTSETIGVSSLGLHINKAYSLQRVELDASVVDYRYQNFDYLNFTAYDYSAAWRWSYTPHLYGNITSSRDQSLNSYADFQGFQQRNVRVSTNSRIDGTVEIDANWRLLAGVGQSALNNLLQLTQEPNYRETSADASARYLLPSGSSAGYRIRKSDGSYLSNRPIPSAGFYDNGYTQTDNDLLATWAISRNLSADLRAGYRSRKHPHYPQRDFGGMTGAASFNWAITGKSAVVAGWTRELSPYESQNSNFTTIDRFSIGPVWQVSPKATVRLNLDHETRDFRGSPNSFVANQRRDTSRTAGMSVAWQPFTYLALDASLQNLRRVSNLQGFEYTTNTFNLSARITY